MEASPCFQQVFGKTPVPFPLFGRKLFEQSSYLQCRFQWLVGLENVYSLEESVNLRSGLSLGYDACCWAVQFEMNRNREEGNDGWRDNTEVMVRLQLKDLGGISSSAVEGVVAGLGLD